jgi:hypothetical protein
MFPNFETALPSARGQASRTVNLIVGKKYLARKASQSLKNIELEHLLNTRHRGGNSHQIGVI